MNDGDLVLEIEGVRRLRDRGRYGDAVCRLEQLIRNSPANLTLTVELGETLFIQGYFSLALDILDGIEDEGGSKDVGLIIFATILRCYAHFHVKLQFEQHMQTVNEAYASYLSGTLSNIVNDVMVRIESYYGQFRSAVESCNAYNDGTYQANLLPRLERIFVSLLDQEYFREALLIARTYAFCSKEATRTRYMKVLAEEDRVPGLYSAQAQLFLARDMKEQSQSVERKSLLASAKRSFQLDNHIHGALDVDFVELYTSTPESDHSSEYVHSKTQKLSRHYEPLQFPSGLAYNLFQVAIIALKASDFMIESQYLSKIEELHAIGQSKLAWTMCRIMVLSILASRLGNYGKVIDAGTALWNDLKDSDCASFRGSAATLVSIAHLQLKDGKKMGYWYERAVIDTGEGNTVVTPEFLAKYDLEAAEGAIQCLSELAAATDPKLPEYSAEAAAMEFELFFRFALPSRHRKSEAWDVFENIITIWEEHISRFEDRNRIPERLAETQIAQSSLLTWRSQSRADIVLEEKALELISSAKDYHLRASELGSSQRWNILLSRENLLYLSIAQKIDREGDDRAKAAWKIAQNKYQAAHALARAHGMSHTEAENAFWVALCQYHQWKHGWYSPDDVLEAFSNAEELLDRLRQEVSILGGMEAITAKRKLGLKQATKDTYELPMKICIHRENLIGAWNWIQKSKARSLSDALGLGALIPGYLMDRINKTPDALQMFESEAAIAAVLSSTPGIGRLRVREKLEDYQKKMRQEPALCELLALRSGYPITFENLSVMNSGTQTEGRYDIVFVDWTIQQDDIWMFLVANENAPISVKLRITVQHVREWILEHKHWSSRAPRNDQESIAFLGMREDDDAEEGPLRELDALVGPLFTLTKPNDLLILSPTSILHSLPLHALRSSLPEQEQILIERNTVAYCASLTTFVQCCCRAEANHRKESRKVFAAVYETVDSAGQDQSFHSDVEERDRIYAHTETVSSSMGGEALCGEEASQARICDAIESMDWVHFFGHNDYSCSSITDQALLMGHAHAKGEDDRAKRVTVENLFKLRVRAMHITLLACASATQDFEVGDEPLGLITAFLSAGASSVLGTLWPVNSAATRYFSERFYYHLKRSDVTGIDGRTFHDLASAIQQAILDTRNNWHFRQPYHWASFALHGAWFYNGTL